MPRFDAVKFAILGDIHANLEALTAVLEDAAAQGATHFACTGDLVGYHTNPHECLGIIRSLHCPVVMGNHDEIAVCDGPIAGMNPVAHRAMEWTREHLSSADKHWLGSLRLVRQVHDFTIVHATLDTPASWEYVLNRFSAMASFSWQFTPVCFHGHTHRPCAFVKSNGHISVADITAPVRLEPGHKYFINTGSVGLPRDGDPRAAYALYDPGRGEVTIRRVPYDYEAVEAKVLKGPVGQHPALLNLLRPANRE
jgi:diadenosine tetraphosphatase ApaH/serine/threonine PP2A family protein phosphatase